RDRTGSPGAAAGSAGRIGERAAGVGGRRCAGSATGVGGFGGDAAARQCLAAAPKSRSLHHPADRRQRPGGAVPLHPRARPGRSRGAVDRRAESARLACGGAGRLSQPRGWPGGAAATAGGTARSWRLGAQFRRAAADRQGLKRMRIGPLQPSLTLAPDRSLPPLRLGAELQAVVRRSSEGRLLLELASGHLLSPRSRVPLRAGDQLQLRVAQLQPVTVLQILSTRRPEQPLQAGLRALLGSDGSRTNLAAGLSQLLDLAATAPPPLRALLAAVAAQVRRPEQLADPRELAAALRDSGLFLEARLLGQPQERPEQDFKAQLLRLLAQ